MGSLQSSNFHQIFTFFFFNFKRQFLKGKYVKVELKVGGSQKMLGGGFFFFRKKDNYFEVCCKKKHFSHMYIEYMYKITLF